MSKSHPLMELLNLRTLRAQSRTYSLEQLQEGLKKLTQVVNERQEEEAKRVAGQREREEKLETYRQLLQADGITVEDLMTLASHSKHKKATRKPRPAKYRYIDDDGHEKTWTGQGRTPTFLVDKNLDDYLI